MTFNYNYTLLLHCIFNPLCFFFIFINSHVHFSCLELEKYFNKRNKNRKTENTQFILSPPFCSGPTSVRHIEMSAASKVALRSSRQPLPSPGAADDALCHPECCPLEFQWGFPGRVNEMESQKKREKKRDHVVINLR